MDHVPGIPSSSVGSRAELVLLRFSLPLFECGWGRDSSLSEIHVVGFSGFFKFWVTGLGKFWVADCGGRDPRGAELSSLVFRSGLDGEVSGSVAA